MIDRNTIKQFDPTTIDLSKLDLRTITLPKFDMPKFDMPAVDLPVDAERIAELARDAAYVGVGAVVVVAQQADERLRHLTGTVSGAVTDALSTASETVAARVRQVVAAVR